ncbi:hypothetical protein [Endozoicomonas sp. ONNA1]|uniref:hypothetical protein n=1 Tax=Endozoicomonas sp. ONNA1 TaxID=2828740 RepID=UPI0021488B9B|nr:hypothetical protein [Endozoicomonas sp. ONNA1]
MSDYTYKNSKQSDFKVTDENAPIGSGGFGRTIMATQTTLYTGSMSHYPEPRVDSYQSPINGDELYHLAPLVPDNGNTGPTYGRNTVASADGSQVIVSSPFRPDASEQKLHAFHDTTNPRIMPPNLDWPERWNDIKVGGLTSVEADSKDTDFSTFAITADGSLLAVKGNNDVHTFTLTDGVWRLNQTITPNYPNPGNFGESIAFNGGGQFLIIADPKAEVYGRYQAGQVMSYSINPSDKQATYGETFTSSSPTTNDKFGSTIAISGVGQDIAIGSVGHALGSPYAGISVIRMFTFDSGWKERSNHILNPEGSMDTGFGSSLSFSEDGRTLIVSHTKAGTDAGALYKYTTSSNSESASWSLAQTITPNTSGSENFGITHALSGDGNTLAITTSVNTSVNGTYSVEVWQDTGSFAFKELIHTDVKGVYEYAPELYVTSDGSEIYIGIKEYAQGGGMDGPNGAVFCYTFNSEQDMYQQTDAVWGQDQAEFGQSPQVANDGTLFVGAPRMHSSTHYSREGAFIAFATVVILSGERGRFFRGALSGGENYPTLGSFAGISRDGNTAYAAGANNWFTTYIKTDDEYVETGNYQVSVGGYSGLTFTDFSLSRNSEFLAIGFGEAYLTDDSGTKCGLVVVYKRNDDNSWSEYAVINDPDGNGKNTRFGTNVAISDDGGLLAITSAYYFTEGIGSTKPAVHFYRYFDDTRQYNKEFDHRYMDGGYSSIQTRPMKFDNTNRLFIASPDTGFPADYTDPVPPMDWGKIEIFYYDSEGGDWLLEHSFNPQSDNSDDKRYGRSFAINDAGTVLYAYNYHPQNTDKAQVEIHYFDGTWGYKGLMRNVPTPLDQDGEIVNIDCSSDGRFVVTGTPKENSPAQRRGTVSIYKTTSGDYSWHFTFSDITTSDVDSDYIGDLSTAVVMGKVIAMNGAGDEVIIGYNEVVNDQSKEGWVAIVKVPEEQPQ